MSEGIKKFANFKEINADEMSRFSNMLNYFSIDTENESDYKKLKVHLEELNNNIGANSNFIFYLSTPPSLYGIVPDMLGKVGLNKSENGSWKRLIIEKPFGYDLQSAIDLKSKVF
jgi:glucose-6-phosphate 1-dehydrogenase